LFLRVSSDLHTAVGATAYIADPPNQDLSSAGSPAGLREVHMNTPNYPPPGPQGGPPQGPYGQPGQYGPPGGRPPQTPPGGQPYGQPGGQQGYGGPGGHGGGPYGPPPPTPPGGQPQHTPPGGQQAYPPPPSGPPQQPGTFPGGPPAAPTPKKGNSKKVRIIAIVVILLVVVGVVLYLQRDAASSAKAGDCIKVNDATSADVQQIDCGSKEAVYKVALTKDDSNAKCPNENYLAYSETGSNELLLCLVFNAKEGDCFKENLKDHTRVDCTSPDADFQIAKVIDGKDDPKGCGPENVDTALTYPEPKLTLCLAAPKGTAS
jgi:hypothetical protein